MTCWICGKPADTAEHKIKKSLLVAVHGKGPYTGDVSLAHVKDGRISDLQGPGSKRITYEDALCADCNNRRTQPFDQAYEKFTHYVLANEALIVARRIIDFAEIYGSDFENGQRDLFKYFVKLFGCDLAHHRHAVPEDLRLLLDRDGFMTRMRITFAVNEDKLLIPSAKDRPIGVGDLITTQRNLSTKDDPKYVWSTFFSFLHVSYWYWWDVDGPLGAEWIADSRYIYLGPLSPEDRRAFIERLKTA